MRRQNLVGSPLRSRPPERRRCLGSRHSRVRRFFCDHARSKVDFCTQPIPSSPPVLVRGGPPATLTEARPRPLEARAYSARGLADAAGALLPFPAGGISEAREIKHVHGHVLALTSIAVGCGGITVDRRGFREPCIATGPRGIIVSGVPHPDNKTRRRQSRLRSTVLRCTARAEKAAVAAALQKGSLPPRGAKPRKQPFASNGTSYKSIVQLTVGHLARKRSYSCVGVARSRQVARYRISIAHRGQCRGGPQCCAVGRARRIPRRGRRSPGRSRDRGGRAADPAGAPVRRARRRDAPSLANPRDPPVQECIRALDQQLDHTPFRGSKLTQVLKDPLRTRILHTYIYIYIHIHIYIYMHITAHACADLYVSLHVRGDRISVAPCSVGSV